MPEIDKTSFAPNVRTVFLDRDGVINEKMPEGQWVQRIADFYVLPGVPEAISRLNRAGIRVIVVTNQRGVALGLFTVADVIAIQSEFQTVLQSHGAHVDGFYFCPHDRDACNCRKPLPGLFEQASKEFPEISAHTSVMIGDSLGDIEFGHRLGMRTIFIEGDPGRQKPGAEQARTLADSRATSLPEAVGILLASR
ncbi:MAG TPA: HAD family hydrolase [Terracidiphilus sp.]|nr:HAD family hydrolase [Terracidiphilus sp.]